MFSRYIDNFDFKSRFRILKGGKVSLVVSAMLFGSTVNAAYTTISSSNSNLLPYSSTLSTNDIVEMASDVNITLASSSIIDVNLNGWLVDISNTGILNNNNNSAASSGIKVYDLSSTENATGKSRIANSGTIAVNNTSFSAYGITSSNSGNKNWNDFNLLNSGTISTRGVEFSKAIFIDGTLEDSTITNNSTGSILATGLDNSTKVYGIHVPGDGTYDGYSIKESQITNNGVITSSGLKSSYGIHMIGKISDSKILNSTTGKITATTTKTLNSNTNINDEISAYTSAMELGNVITNTNGTETSVKNAGTIESNTTANIQLGGSITTKGIYAASRGVYINKLTGSDTTGTSKFENSGNISATSKLKFTGGAILNANNFGYSSESSGLLASNVYKALIDNTSTGNITTLSEMDIESSYRITNVINPFVYSTGMQFNTLEDSTVNNNGMIDSKAIYNSKDPSSATSKSIYVGDIISSDIISKNMKSTAQSSSIFNVARAASVGIESMNIKDSSTLKNIGIIDVNGTSNAITASTAIYGIRSFGMDTSNIINGIENGDNSTVQIKVAGESISRAEADITAKGIEIVNFIDSTIKNYGKIDVTGTTSSSSSIRIKTEGISLISDVSSSSEPIYSVLNEGTIIVKSNPTVTNSQNQIIDVLLPQ